MRKLQLFTVTLFLLFIISCSQQLQIAPLPPEEPGNEDSPGGSKSFNFNFSMTEEISVDISVARLPSHALAGTKIEIFSHDNGITGHLLSGGFFDKKGKFTTTLVIPTYVKEVHILLHRIGFDNEAIVPIKNRQLKHTFNTKNSKYKKESSISLNNTLSTRNSSTSGSYNYLGSWDSNGVPLYLEPAGDTISLSLLADINSSLPERQPVPQYNPQYLESDIDTNTIIIDTAQVWVTFVHEGAGFKNTLGFYTYPTGSPPPSISDSDITIIFPNVSYSGSGGGLSSGDKVYLGSFEAGTTIGWVLIANGWNGSTVSSSSYKLYSDDDYNPENNPNLRRHNVLLNDSGRELLLLAFEDLKRDRKGCDNDFNDAIFYVTANPPESVKTDSLEELKEAADSDMDGIADDYDQYPSDPERAFDNYYPAVGSYATLAFEDLWPRQGDYDFNDLILDYRIKEVQNAFNETVKIELTYIIKAAGAGYRNGFGIQLEASPTLIQEVSGIDINKNYIELDSRGQESGQSKATIICSDDIFMTMGVWETIVNTRTDKGYISPKTVNISVTFTRPLKAEELGSAPYNHFLIINGDRGRELHEMDKTPTDKLNNGYLNSYEDRSSKSKGRYYQTTDKNPWVLNFPDQFDYPKEQISVKAAYNRFQQWAESEGALYPDWYLELPGYKNSNLLYSKN